MWRGSSNRTNECRGHEKRQRKFPPHDTPPINRCNLTAEVKCSPDDATWGTNKWTVSLATKDAACRGSVRSFSRVAEKLPKRSRSGARNVHANLEPKQSSGNQILRKAQRPVDCLSMDYPRETPSIGSPLRRDCCLSWVQFQRRLRLPQSG